MCALTSHFFNQSELRGCCNAASDLTLRKSDVEITLDCDDGVEEVGC